MNSADPLQLFRQVMWVSGLVCTGLVFLLLCMTVWRQLWVRILNWEERLWRRIGIGAGLAAYLRRIEDSQMLKYVIVLLLAVHFALLIVSAGAHLYFAPKLKSRSGPALQEQKRGRNVERRGVFPGLIRLVTQNSQSNP